MRKFDYNTAHTYSNNHKPELEKDSICGCFYCLKLHISFLSGDKLFQYPAGIEKGFLTVPDGDLMEKIVLEIKTKADLDVAEKKAVDAKKEYERLQKEMGLI